RRCAIHNEHVAAFQALYPAAMPFQGETYISDRGVLTCPGGTAALDLAFHLIEMHCGKARAVKGVSSLFAERHRPVRKLYYRPYGNLVACGNRRVETAIAMMERHIASPYSISRLAHRVGCSERELCRLFKKFGNITPSESWRNIRLSHGH